MTDGVKRKKGFSIKILDNMDIRLAVAFSPSGSSSYLGCFRDSRTRVLKEMRVDSHKLTNDLCVGICKQEVR